MSRPTPLTTLPGLLLAGLLVFLFWFASLGNAQRDLPSSYFIVWQMQLGWGAAGLPILLFVIQVSAREELGLQKTGDVLGRVSLILPIVGVVLGLLFAMGVGALVWRSSWSYPIAVGSFLFSTGLTALAYARLAEHLFDRQKLVDASRRLLLKRFSGALENGLQIRLRAEVLMSWAEGRGDSIRVGRMAVRDSMAFAAPPGAGLVRDANLHILEAVLFVLNPERPATSETSALLPDTSEREGTDPPRIILRKLPGDTVWEFDREMVVVEGELRRDQEERISRLLAGAFRYGSER